MRIGKSWWSFVTTDSTCVPKGGRYGRVAWFEDKIKQKGLTLGWSRRDRCFVILTRTGPGKWIFQIHCRKGGPGSPPTPLTNEYLWLLLYLWEHNRRTMRNASAVMAGLKQMEADHMAEQYAEVNADTDEAMRDAVDATDLESGRRTTKILSAPGLVVPRYASAMRANKQAARAYRRRQIRQIERSRN